MEFTGIQITITVIVILGAAGLALMVDHLKNKNDQLREAMVELQAQRAEKAMRAAVSPAAAAVSPDPRILDPRTVDPRTADPRTADPRTADPRLVRKQEAPPQVAHAVSESAVGAGSVAVAVAPVAAADQAAAMVVAKAALNHRRNEPRSATRMNGQREDSAASLVRKSTPRNQKPAASNGLSRNENRTPDITSVSGHRPTPSAPAADSIPKKEDMATNDALTDWLRRRAAFRAGQAKQAAAPQEPQSAPVAVQSLIVPVASEPVAAEPVAAEPIFSEPVAIEQVASKPVADEQVATVSEPAVTEAVEVPVVIEEVVFFETMVALPEEAFGSSEAIPAIEGTLEEPVSAEVSQIEVSQIEVSKIEAAPVEEPAAIEPVHEQPFDFAPPAPVVETVQVTSLPEVQIDAFLWESLLSDKPAKAAPAVTSWQTAATPAVSEKPATAEAPAAPEAHLQLIRGSSATSEELLVPPGMYDETHLTRLLGINKPFTGLVLSISISENDGTSPRNEDLIRAAEYYIGNLLGDTDFGCRTGVDEFVMICPGQAGADAQRRLTGIAARLWDYQLRGIGAFTTMFSWGGVESVQQPLSEALSSAVEQMRQTKRTRKTVSMDPVSHRRKAV